MTELLIKDANERMSKTRSILEKELSSVRTGRASSSLVENLNVDYFGTPTPLIHLASITVPEARLIVIQPFDRNSIPAIEKTILQSDIGISPAVDGEVIRLPIPSLTQERRKQIAKTVRSKTEAEKISVRNVRRDILDQMKKNLKKKELSEDDAKRASDQIQKITDQYVNQIESIGSAKEAEVMEV
jgi:ribosome recycling factor